MPTHLQWPDDEHQDFHHKNMETRLPKGIPFAINKAESIFFSLLRQGRWLEAARMVMHQQVAMQIVDGHCNNLFDYAATYVTSSWRDDSKIQILLNLVEQAKKSNVKIRMNYYFYMNPLHILARGKEDNVTLKILDYLLENSDPVYLNAYNKFGKTPLLEAISNGNKETALRLLKHPDIDVNVFKIHNISTREDAYRAGIIENYNIKHGSSAFDAASLLIPEVAEFIKAHPKYDPTLQYKYPNSGDIIRKGHFLFAEQGNVDTLKVLFKNYDPRILMEPDALGWTMLHIACFSANIPVIEFLLDKKQIDEAVGKSIDETVYRRFINFNSNMHTTALGRFLFYHFDGDDDMKKKQISLFIKCLYFDINRGQNFDNTALIHYVAEYNLQPQMDELSRRKGVNFDERDARGRTALQMASEQGHWEMVKFLSSLAQKGCKINPNQLNGQYRIAEKLVSCMEESWFGEEVSLEVSIYDLIEICRTGESYKVEITYQQADTNLDINFVRISPGIDPEEMKRYLVDCFNRFVDQVDMDDLDYKSIYADHVDYPEWADPHLYGVILSEISKKAQGKIETEIQINIPQFVVKLSSKSVGLKTVSKTGTISREYILDHVQLDESNDFTQEYKPLLITVIEHAQQAENKKDTKMRDCFVEVFRYLLQFPNINLNLLTKTKSGPSNNLEDIITLPAILEILKEKEASNATREVTVDLEKSSVKSRMTGLSWTTYRTINKISELLPPPSRAVSREDFIGLTLATEHPKYEGICNIVRKLGYAIALIDEGDSHVEIIRKKDGNIEKKLCLRRNAPWLDFEHEVGHIKQTLRFQDKVYFTHTEVKKKSQVQKEMLTKKMDTIVEVHNRLHEFNRLFYRRAPFSVLWKHAVGLNEYLGDYQKLLESGRQAATRGGSESSQPFGSDSKAENEFYRKYFERDFEQEYDRCLKHAKLYDNKFRTTLRNTLLLHQTSSVDCSIDEYQYTYHTEKELLIDIEFLLIDISESRFDPARIDEIEDMKTQAEKNNWDQAIDSLKKVEEEIATIKYEDIFQNNDDLDTARRAEQQATPDRTFSGAADNGASAAEGVGTERGRIRP